MTQNFLHFQISKITIFVSLFIIVSASFASQVIEFIQSYIGDKRVTTLIGLMMIVVCLLFLIFVTKKRIHVIKTPALILVLIIGLILAWQVKYPAEKVHYLEYGVLGWLAARDLIRVNITRKKSAIILAAFFCIAIGIVDELFQRILPYRVYDVRDIAFNGIGGILGIILYLLT